MGTDLVSLDHKQLREYRGTEIAMVFQEPLSSLNPVYRVGDQIAEAIIVRQLRKAGHVPSESEFMQRTYKVNSTRASRFPRLRRGMASQLEQEIIEVLKLVRIPDPKQILHRYPFELSGGMRQRIMIAMALSEEPSLLIADEPTTALDVTTQAQVLRLMRELMKEVKTSILLISHDLAVASQVADRVIVMYAGEIVEDANVYELFSNPLHPYTQGLLSCIPSGFKDEVDLKPIPGSVPDLMTPPIGCMYASRCPRATTACSERRPRSVMARPNHKVACFLDDE
jgi:oligopeptide/dipeptide ABC transporter ATP-binding protein